MLGLRQRVLFLLQICAALLLVSSVSHADVTRWNVNGVRREATIVPPSVGTGKAPVVFAFHGHGGNMRGIAQQMDVEDVWPEAIVVYMQGLSSAGAADPEGTKSGWQFEPGQNDDRDLKFVDAVLDTLREKYKVDDSRIYSIGFSDGAFFAYVLWAERPKIFAAFALCAGKIFPAVHPTEPKAVFIVDGVLDKRVPVRERNATIRTARVLNGAMGGGESCGEGCTLYLSRKSANVKVFIHSGGHEYPGSITTAIVRFFKDPAHKN